MGIYKMKLGIITLHRSMNYGAVLQAYALQEVLERLGTEPTIIDYVRNYNYTGSSIFAPWSTYKNIIINCFALLRYKKAKNKINRFKEFYNEFYRLSTDRFYSCDDLTKIARDYDAFICGSDQIWRPSDNNDQTRAYYLDFAGKAEAKKIAYAPSFGLSTVPDGFRRIIRPFINNFQYLSTREETGKRIILETTGRIANVVLDPTMLLNSEQWLKIAVPPVIKTAYILVYAISQKRDICNLVKHVKNKTALPIVVISPTALNLVPNTDYVIYDASPREYVRLFANASCVCTNSFHGMAFSIINRLPFWTTPHRVANSRLTDLLQRIKLSDRQVHCTEEFPDNPLDINYSDAELILNKARDESISFLEESLYDN